MEDPVVKEELIVMLKAVNNWVHNLKILGMKCSLDMNLMTLYLPLLTSMELGYGIKHAGSYIFLFLDCFCFNLNFSI